MVDFAQILVNRVSRTPVPEGLVHLLLGRHDFDELTHATVQKAPGQVQVPNQALGLVLRCHADAPHAGVDTVGQREIDDAKFAAERHGRLGTPVGQALQATAPPARQHHGKGVTRELADVARIALEAGAVVQRLLCCHACCPLWLSWPMVTAVTACERLTP